MIRLQHALFDEIERPSPTVAAVQRSLQRAIELEHATIPPYLYALYSLDETLNPQIAALIFSVVRQEMLHMCLSSNILNAIGGRPSIDRPDFIPRYPGRLPGGVEKGLVVHLLPFSMEQVETFMTIEEPEHSDDGQPPPDPAVGRTIGEFYTAISKALAQLPASSFDPSGKRQVSSELMRGSIVVTDLTSAQAAITTIIDQGEGTSVSPQGGQGELAHYYRFKEIHEGRALIQLEGKWVYRGAVIPFNPKGVYPAPSNPKGSSYPHDSIAAAANRNFNGAYTSLLAVLHDLFNGQNDAPTFHRALALMMSMKEQAKGMMSSTSNYGQVHIGPSFEYQALNG
ncbi:MAG: hypothetical protein RL685_4263 [Pseudomonadota bacterium]